MKELIIRIKSDSEDAEVLFNDLFAEEVTEKSISREALMECLERYTKKDEVKLPLKLFEKNVIGYNRNKELEIFLVNQASHSRYVTYSIGKEEKAVKINFPNSIYLIQVRASLVNRISAYMYFEWHDEETELYKYAMPNMLSGDSICMGSANKRIDGSLMQTLENIIYAPYSHAELNNIKGFRSTKSYFEYLENNHILEKHLTKTNFKLAKLLEGDI